MFIVIWYQDPTLEKFSYQMNIEVVQVDLVQTHYIGVIGWQQNTEFLLQIFLITFAYGVPLDRFDGEKFIWIDSLVGNSNCAETSLS